MFIARVRGNVVTTQKVATMAGRKLLLVEPMRVDPAGKELTPAERTFVAVDSVGAGQDDLVLITQGSSARMSEGNAHVPVDCVIIGIIDAVQALGNEVYRKDGPA